MIRRYTYIPIVFLILSALAWWSTRVESSIPRDLQAEPLAAGEVPLPETIGREATTRRQLVEVLDRLVAYQHYYHSVYGRFTKLLSRVGYSVPREVSEHYEIRVVEATEAHLLITAMTEVDGKVTDLVSIDQDFAVKSNASLPTPQKDYLKIVAMRHLRALRDAPAGQIIEEQGVFKGYFKYEVRQDSQDRKVAFAVGVRQPVLGLQVEVQARGQEGVPPYAIEPEISEMTEYAQQTTGQRSNGNVHHSLQEETYLAQRIFRGEMGRYARNWSELSQIAHFRFEGKDEGSRSLSSHPTQSGPGLEIEPISPEEAPERVK
jgi:hypothetical protein